MKKSLKVLVTVCLIVYLSVLGWIYANQTSLLYFPDRQVKNLDQYDLDGTKEVFLTTADGIKIQAWYHLPREDKSMVIFLHGNAGNLSTRYSKFKELLDMGYGFVAISWRGFGKSEGTPSKEGLYNDARAAVAFLRSLGFKTENTIMIGESLGSGIASQMALENKFKGLFLITPYTSIADRAQEIYWYLPVKYLVLNNFSTIDKLNKIDEPVLIVHGTNDDVIPHQHAEAILEKAHEPKKLITFEGKRHNNLDNKVIFNEMDKFFNEVAKGEDEVTER